MQILAALKARPAAGMPALIVAAFRSR